MNISVIIPVKNRASLLPITLNCVLNQTKKPFEIIVVDDASTDDIDKVIAEYSDRVVFIKNKGKGPGAARNAGLRLAKGDAIQFFDSDDLMTLNKLEVQARMLEQQNADLVYGPWVKAVAEGDTWKQTDVIMQYYPLAPGKLADYVLQGWCNITQSVLIRKSVIDKVGFWREDLMPHEDLEYWYRIGKGTEKYCHENETCVIYRQHQNQITDLGVANDSRWLDGINAMKFIEQEIAGNPTRQSMWLFKGRQANSKRGFIKRFGARNEVKVSPFALFFIGYFKIKNKLGRVKNTIWQQMNGVSADAAAFEKYIKLLNR